MTVREAATLPLEDAGLTNDLAKIWQLSPGAVVGPDPPQEIPSAWIMESAFDLYLAASLLSVHQLWGKTALRRPSDGMSHLRGMRLIEGIKPSLWRQ